MYEIGSKEEKLSARGYVGYEKERPTYGKMRTSLEVVQPLPQIGSIISVYETIYLDRNQYDGLLRIRSYKTPAAGCKSATGKVKRFEVTGYSKGIDRPLDNGNHMYLKTVYPDEAIHSGGITTFPTIQVAVGVLTIIVIEGGTADA